MDTRIDTFFTLGHSTRSLSECISILVRHRIQQVIDVRTIPQSRHNPQYNQQAFSDVLLTAGIAYTHMKGLGGLRAARHDSINRGLKNESFRGFADYMQTPAFEGNIRALIACGQNKKSLILCAEALPWKCHRLFIADALLIRGISVEHILSSDALCSHTLSPLAKVDGTVIAYQGCPEENYTILKGSY